MFMTSHFMWKGLAQKNPFHFIVIFVKMKTTPTIIFLALFIAVAGGGKIQIDKSHPVRLIFFKHLIFQFELCCKILTLL